jgi:Holliday junction DNA helicase RuvA
MGLGYPAKEAEKAVEAVAAQVDEGQPDVGALLRAALRTLSKA